MHIIHLLRSSTKVRGWKNKGRGIGCTSTWERNRARFQQKDNFFIWTKLVKIVDCAYKWLLLVSVCNISKITDSWSNYSAQPDRKILTWLRQPPPPPSTHGASFRAFRLAIFISKVTSFQVSVALFRQSPPFLSLNFFWQLQSPLHYSIGDNSIGEILLEIYYLRNIIEEVHLGYREEIATANWEGIPHFHFICCHLRGN